MQNRIRLVDLHEYIGQEVTVAGWVDGRRDHGKIVFLDLRDATGKLQTVSQSALEGAERIRPEWVVSMTGVVNKRPLTLVNAAEPNGDIELKVSAIEVLNEAATPPFAVNEDTRTVNENLRLKYRYLDLRAARMQKNIRARDKIISFFRDYMHRHDFVEIETPILTAGTPEGSREYVVPSRLAPGRFYALPQSPQQFKQLAMIAGFEKYFQIARCFRDEDTRGDRQPEFTQLDFEMSFVTREEVLAYTEAMFIELVQKLYPQKKISRTPFPRFTYADCLKQCDSDKPDLRQDKNNPDELAFVWLVDFPMFEKGADGSLQATHHPFCAVKEEDREKFMKGEDLLAIRADAYDLVLNGYELSSGSIRIHEPAVQKQVFNLLQIPEVEQERRFGHLLEAFTYGAPPHGGFAPGIDRIVMILENEPNIREVIAFPKTGEAEDLLMNAPSEISAAQLAELKIKLEK